MTCSPSWTSSRREQLALIATKAEQVLVTAAVGSDVPDQLRGLWFDVQDGTVQRVAEQESTERDVTQATPSSTEAGGKH